MAGKKFSLKGLFIEQTDSAAATTGQAQPAAPAQPAPSATPRRGAPAASTPAPAPVQPVTAAAAPASSGPVADDQSLALLERAIEDANQEGYDYLEFRKAVKQQESIIADEKVRFQAALAAASVMGVTAQKLVDSAQYYLAVLKAKERDFQQAQDAAMSKEVGGREEQIARTAQEITQKAQQVADLTRQIGELQKRSDELAREMAEKKAAIEGVKGRFYSTLQAVTGRIDTDVAKVKNYLMNA